MLRYVFPLFVFVIYVSAGDNDSIQIPENDALDTTKLEEKLRNLDITTPERATFDSLKDTAPYYYVEIKPSLIKIPDPGYPVVARRGGVSGTAVVKALVDVDGHVKRVEIMHSSGSSTLDNAALEAAKKAIYTPGVLRGRLVRTWVSIPFRFRLVEKQK